jgi:hypothetical protein
MRSLMETPSGAGLDANSIEHAETSPGWESRDDRPESSSGNSRTGGGAPTVRLGPLRAALGFALHHASRAQV